MIRNRTAQIIFQTVYIVLGFIGFIGSLGYFRASFNTNFYLYYTNLSNYICTGVMIACFVQTIRASIRKEDGYVTVSPKFYFMSIIMILVTCLVYNFLLAKSDYNSFGEYCLAISNFCNHLILPIMFVVHWILFYEHGKSKWYYPLLCVIIPLIYVLLIVIRALILGANYTGLKYPYFFLNVDKLGWGGFFGWVFALICIFVVLGYIIYICDNIAKWIRNRKQNKKQG